MPRPGSSASGRFDGDAVGRRLRGHARRIDHARRGWADAFNSMTRVIAQLDQIASSDPSIPELIIHLQQLRFYAVELLDELEYCSAELRYDKG